MAQYTEGLKTTSLSTGLLLAEIPPDNSGTTGQLPSIWLSASVVAEVELQHRNAANNSNIYSHRFYISAAQPQMIAPPPGVFVLEANERLRVVLAAGLLLGAVQASLLT